MERKVTKVIYVTRSGCVRGLELVFNDARNQKGKDRTERIHAVFKTSFWFTLQEQVGI